MSKIYRDFSGQKIGHWLIIERSNKKDKHGTTYWKCVCDCKQNIIKDVNIQSILKGQSKSCGCETVKACTTHGKSKSKIYQTWNRIIQRCENCNCEDYIDYGARGIRVCAGWRNSFISFYNDMGERPDRFSIDRINNNMNYSCGHCEECLKHNWVFNCRWADTKTQSHNKRNNINLIFNGKEQCVSEWAKETGISFSAIRYRVDHGWSIEDALTIKVKPRN